MQVINPTWEADASDHFLYDFYGGQLQLSKTKR